MAFPAFQIDSMSPLSATISLCFVVATLGGFPVVNILRNRQAESKALVNTNATWWARLYVVTFALAMLLTLHTESSVIQETFQRLSWIAVLAPRAMPPNDL